MFIVTTDEDILRQLHSHQLSNIQIIDLDDETNQNKNLISSEGNSVEIHKRELDASEEDRSKSKRSPTCVVCSGSAIGCNYNALTCASCKAFFARNASQDLEKLRCFSDQGQCSIVPEIRPKCPKCRLKRCFSMGMRKDFLLTEDERRRRKKYLKESRNVALNNSSNQDEIHQVINNNNNNQRKEIIHRNEIQTQLLECLSMKDGTNIEYVQSLILTNFQRVLFKYTSLHVSDCSSAVISLTYIASRRILSCVDCFRHVNEFRNLDGNDRFILFKYNFIFLYPIFTCFYYDRQHKCLLNEDNEEILKRFQFFQTCFQSSTAYLSFINLVVSLVEITDQDSLYLSLLLIIILFSQSFSANENKLFLKDSLTVYRIQSNYVTILWRYLMNKQGELQSYKQFIQLLKVFYDIESTLTKLVQYMHSHVTTSDVEDQVAPLMQSILHFS